MSPPPSPPTFSILKTLAVIFNDQDNKQPLPFDVAIRDGAPVYLDLPSRNLFPLIPIEMTPLTAYNNASFQKSSTPALGRLAPTCELVQQIQVCDGS